MLDVVLALKLSTFGKIFSLGRLRRWSSTTAVFPVPVGPTNKMGMSLARQVFRKNRWQQDWLVWMISSLASKREIIVFIFISTNVRKNYQIIFLFFRISKT